jgi:ornithine cyclodeaminase/alanine dehydrogenase
MEQKFLYLSFDDVQKINLSMPEVIQAVEAGFVEMGHGRAEMPPKNAIHPGGGDNYIHGMPCLIPGLKSAGIKWVAGYPGNQRLSLPYNTGLLLLNDLETGVICAVMDCRWITTKRTGAASAISAKYLARPESETLAIIACGVQGHSNLEAMKTQFPGLKKVRAFDPMPAQSAKLVAFAHTLGLDAEAVTEPEKAVRDADIIVSSGPILKKPYDTVKEGWMKEGAFASLVDFDSSWSRQALAAASKWTTDNIAQYEHYKDLGYFQNCPPLYAELNDIVVGKKKGRENAKERNFAANLGLALDDMAVAPIIFKRAQEMGLGAWLPL